VTNSFGTEKDHDDDYDDDCAERGGREYDNTSSDGSIRKY
jgi:hypothetical protein